MSESRWTQDREVFELIEHLNQPGKKGDWLALTKEEIAVVLGEVDRCRKDFVYAARNYFWITSKDFGDKLLTLNESQELIYQKMLEIKEKIGTTDKAVKLVIIKGRQLGCSTLIEALIAWRTIFFRNVNALVVSYDRGHTADVLFPIMQTVYDRLPWWLQPECASRRIDEGLYFATRDPKLRSENPGMNSRVYVKAANTTTSVGMGFRLNAVHVSEFAAFDEKTAKTIIDEEMRHAIVDNCNSFAVLESTAKGANKYAHTLWKKCEELAEQADWYPLFLPAFFESKRKILPPPKWKIAKQELMIRDQVVSQWLRCDNQLCLGYHIRTVQGQDRSGVNCPTCNTGKLHPYILTDSQIYFMEYHRLNSARDEEATKKLKQELCCSGDEMVSTEKGIVRLRNSAEARYLETGEKNGWFDNGLKECVRIKTRCGRSLVATPNHLIQCEDGSWVEAVSSIGKKISLSKPMFSPTLNTVRWTIFPGGVYGYVTIDSKWARFLGYFMGDGCLVGNKGINVACTKKDHDVVTDVCDLIEYIIGKRPIVRDEGGMTLVESNDHRWKNILQLLGCVKESEHRRVSEGYTRRMGNLSRRVCVPDCIWRSPEHVIKEFLSALFECDGHAYVDNPRTAFFSKYEEFTRHVQLLLLGFGINSRITRATKKNGNGLPYIGSDMRLNAIASNIFHEKIGFISQRKRSACTKEKLGKNTQKHEMNDLVESVEPAGIHRVYDISVVNSHKFGATGIMVHNCTSALEAFQVQGIQVFGNKAQEFAARCVREPIAMGHFDVAGRFHGENKNSEYGRSYHEKYGRWPCFRDDCDINHEYDDNHLLIWEWPVKNANYTIGGDVAEGLGGKYDYSVGAVTINTENGADRQVATWRSNNFGPIEFAYQLNWLGLMYNCALMAVECNKYDACLGALRFNLNYPNMYRWKHIDSINVNSNKLGWFTDVKSRPRLYQTLKLWLNQEMFFITSKNCYNEMLNFVKEDEDSMFAGGDKKEHDDEIMSIMIALFCSKEGQWNPMLGMALPPQSMTKENSAYTVHCMSCQQEWYTNQVEDRALNPTVFVPELGHNGTIIKSGGIVCDKCESRKVEITRNQHTGREEIRVDGDVVSELGNYGWSPEDEWEKFGYQDVSYGML